MRQPRHQGGDYSTPGHLKQGSILGRTRDTTGVDVIIPVGIGSKFTTILAFTSNITQEVEKKLWGSGGKDCGPRLGGMEHYSWDGQTSNRPPRSPMLTFYALSSQNAEDVAGTF